MRVDDLISLVSRVYNISIKCLQHFYLMFSFYPFRAVLPPTFSLRLRRSNHMLAQSMTSKTAAISTSAWTLSTPTWRSSSLSLQQKAMAQLPMHSNLATASTTRWTAMFKLSQLNQLPLCRLIIITVRPLSGKRFNNQHREDQKQLFDTRLSFFLF